MCRTNQPHTYTAEPLRGPTGSRVTFRRATGTQRRNSIVRVTAQHLPCLAAPLLRAGPKLQNGGRADSQHAGAAAAAAAAAARGRRLEQPLSGPEGRAGGRHGQTGGPGSRRLRRLRWQRDSRGLGSAGAPQPRRRGGRGAAEPCSPALPRGVCGAGCDRLPGGGEEEEACLPRGFEPLSSRGTPCAGAGHAAARAVCGIGASPASRRSFPRRCALPSLLLTSLLPTFSLPSCFTSLPSGANVSLTGAAAAGRRLNRGARSGGRPCPAPEDGTRIKFLIGFPITFAEVGRSPSLGFACSFSASCSWAFLVTGVPRRSLEWDVVCFGPIRGFRWRKVVGHFLSVCSCAQVSDGNSSTPRLPQNCLL